MGRIRKFGRHNWDKYDRDSLKHSDRFLKMLPDWLGKPTNEFLDEKARRGFIYKTPTAYFEFIFSPDGRFFGFYQNNLRNEEYDFLFYLRDHIPELVFKNLIFEMIRHGVQPPHSDSEVLE